MLFAFFYEIVDTFVTEKWRALICFTEVLPAEFTGDVLVATNQYALSDEVVQSRDLHLRGRHCVLLSWRNNIFLGAARKYFKYKYKWNTVSGLRTAESRSPNRGIPVSGSVNSGLRTAEIRSPNRGILVSEPQNPGVQVGQLRTPNLVKFRWPVNFGDLQNRFVQVKLLSSNMLFDSHLEGVNANQLNFQPGSTELGKTGAEL